MRVTVDINVLLDVFQQRQPHYAAAVQVMSMVTAGELEAFIPAHALTTLYYLVRKHAAKQNAEAAMDRVLQHFQIANLNAAGWREARSLGLDDFEDAAVAVAAEVSGSQFIITRNTDDFAGSPVEAICPEDFLSRITPAN